MNLSHTYQEMQNNIVPEIFCVKKSEGNTQKPVLPKSNSFNRKMNFNTLRKIPDWLLWKHWADKRQTNDFIPQCLPNCQEDFYDSSFFPWIPCFNFIRVSVRAFLDISYRLSSSSVRKWTGHKNSIWELMIKFSHNWPRGVFKLLLCTFAHYDWAVNELQQPILNLIF